MLNQNILQDALKQNFVKVLGLDDLSEKKTCFNGKNNRNNSKKNGY